MAFVVIVVVASLCVASLFVAPESRILLPRVATVRMFYDKGVEVSMIKNGGGWEKRGKKKVDSGFFFLR